jgi:hypothetical protein
MTAAPVARLETLAFVGSGWAIFVAAAWMRGGLSHGWCGRLDALY